MDPERGWTTWHGSCSARCVSGARSGCVPPDPMAIPAPTPSTTVAPNELARHPGLVAGILVGGEARRLGGFPKGLLRGPSGDSLVDALGGALRALQIPYVHVGRHPAYAICGEPTLDDERGGIGPLGGLLTLFRHAGSRDVLALACGLPFVSIELLGRLATACPGAAAVAPRRARGWEPLFARYAAREALPIAERRAAAGRCSLQGLLDELDARVLPLGPEDDPLLDDWDSPGDVHT